ncbi:alpha/beta fold hydrolase [Falsiroseomonas sp.]|uniref:alpha/beta fold hydrolase n=1 Tax=Falsiroseomonas sp. TaxID=2870721 RepID=UPI0035646EB8
MSHNATPALRGRSGAAKRVAAILLGSAAALGAAALQAQADARRAEREHPPRGRFLAAGGIRLHYLEAGHGDASPVVLLHGNSVSAEDWVASGVFGRVAGRRRVIALDRPGFGYSDRPRDRAWTPAAQAAVLAEAFARLGLERPVVVGQSWGTLVAMALGLAHPRAVSGLVLAAGYYYPTARADVVAFSPAALPLFGDILRHTLAPLTGRLIAPRMIRRMFAPMPVPPAFTEAVPVPMMLRPSQLRAASEEAALMIPGVRAAAPRYPELRRLPVAIVAGAEDRIVDVGRHSLRLHDELPDSELTLVPGMGHMVHHGAPGLVAAAIERIAAATVAPVPAFPAPV